MGRLWGGRYIQGWTGLVGRDGLLVRDRLLVGDRLLGEGGIPGVVGLLGVGDGLWEDEAGVLPLLGEGGIRDGAK